MLVSLALCRNYLVFRKKKTILLSCAGYSFGSLLAFELGYPTTEASSGLGCSEISALGAGGPWPRLLFFRAVWVAI